MLRLFVGLYQLFVILSVVFPSAVYAEDIAVKSRITAVSVYNDRADVTRHAVVDIPAGSHNLVLNGLPVRLFPDSLRVKGISAASVTFGAITHKRENHENYIVPREKELRAQITVLEDQRKDVQDEKLALQAGRTFLESLGKQAALRSNEEIAQIKLNPQDWAGAADSITAKMLENLKNVQTLNIKQRDLNEKIAALQGELQGLRTGQKQSYHVTIPFEADKPARLALDLSYQLPDASWYPVYDARLDVESGDLALVQYGAVQQRTGEDWDGIALTLSTAQPSRGAGLPDLNTQWISLYNPQVRHLKQQAFGGMAGAPMAEMAVMEDSADRLAMAAPEPVKEAKFAAAQIDTDGFVGEYKIAGPANVKADGTQAKLMIGAFETENAVQVQIKPQMSNDAYLVVKTTLKGDAPILPGTVNLFRDGAYIGQSNMPMLRPEDAEELAFGIDDLVRVKRNILKDESGQEGLIAKENVIEKHFTTDIQNLHKNAIDIALLETVPVSQDKDLRVEILKDKTTQGYEENLHDVKGLLRWHQNLKPGEQQKINLGWKVSWPKDKNISGL